jgi:hypothetical protein
MKQSGITKFYKGRGGGRKRGRKIKTAQKVGPEKKCFV